MRDLWTSSLIARTIGLCFATSLCFSALNSQCQPANDNFVDAEVLPIAGLWGQAAGDVTDATSEDGEPSHAGQFASGSVWYKWIAPRSAEVTFDTEGSGFPAILAVYQGSSVGGLKQIAANDGALFGGNSKYDYVFRLAPTAGPGLVRFNAKQDQVYYIAVQALGMAEDPTLVLNWAYKPSGVFHFTLDEYVVSETETYTRAPDHISMARHDQSGAVVTITRSMGSSGRVRVSFAPEDDTAINMLDYFLMENEVVFNEYEMSRTIVVPIVESDPPVLEVPADDPILAFLRSFKMRITEVALDEGESSEVAPPRISTAMSETLVTILDADVDPVVNRNLDTNDPPAFVGPSNAVINIEKKWFRVAEDEGQIVIYLTRSGDNNASVTVHYGINVTDNYSDTHRDNSFSLLGRMSAGADYATPDPENLGWPGRGADYGPVYGTVTFGQNDWQPKPITIPIHEDLLPELNEDFLLTIWGEKDGSRFRLGLIDRATVTILADPSDQPAGAVDIFYNPDKSLNTVPPYMPQPGADATVFGLNMDPDDKTLIVGDFASYNTVPRNRVARVNPDGSLDATFNPGEGANDFVSCVSRDSAGRYLIGGAFSFYNGVQRNGIARLNSGGTLDTTFAPGTGANGTVWAIAIQEDGKILVGGDFTSFNGHSRRNIVRLNEDGSVDDTFDPGDSSPNGPVNAILAIPSGPIVIGGEFSGLGAVNVPNFAALTTGGQPDTAFNFKLGLSVDGPVYALALHQGGIVLGGEFTSINGFEHTRLARVNGDGSVDTAFESRVGADDTVYSITPATGGALYIGGLFSSFNGTHRVGFARLFPNGTVDTSFLDTTYNQFAGFPRKFHNSALSPRGFVWAAGVASDGGVIIAGGFSQVGGGYGDSALQPIDGGYYFDSLNRATYRNRNNLARLVGGETPGPGNISLAYDSYSVNQQQDVLNVSLLRENGALGYASANLVVDPASASAGTDFQYNAIPPVYRGSWGLSRMMTDGFYGLNTLMNDIYGRFWTDRGSVVPVVTILNPGTAGNRFAQFELNIPSGADHWYPGGENIPINAAIGKSRATLTIVDDNRDPGKLGFTMSAYAVSEGTNATITVQRTDGSAGIVQVNFQTGANGTAVKNLDYFATNGTLTFGAGVLSKTFQVRIPDNYTVQSQDRTVELLLSNPNGNPAAPSLGITNATLSIVDNDFPYGFVNFSSATFATNEGAGAVVLTLTRTGGSTGVLRVHYRTADGTALSGVNYVGATNYVEWGDAETAPKQITIPFLPNDTVGTDLYFTNVLFDAVIRTGTNNTALGGTVQTAIRIIEDDSYGLLQFSTASYRVSETAGKATITVVRTAGSSQSVTVNYGTAAGTAVPTGVAPNYVSVGGQLAFAPGEVAKSFEVPILRDYVDNDDESPFFFSVVLSNTLPTGLLGPVSVAQVNIIDAEDFNAPPGTLDLTFNADPGFNGEVFALQLQEDGKVLAGGDFTLANSIARSRIARLNADGSLDTGFQQGMGGANGPVRSVLLQTDGRILLAGGFTQVNGAARNRLARLLTDGQLDTSFNPGVGADGTVFILAETFSGTNRTILMGGAFNTVNGQVRQGLARLKNNGALDETFSSSLTIGGAVYAIAVYPTNSIHAGKILIGGNFQSVNGQSRNSIARLNPDGTLDVSFDPGSGANEAVRAIAIQADGKVLIGGAFTSYRGQAVNRFARLTVNGLLDATFNVGQGANDTVEAIKVLADNRILLTGQFTSASGLYRSRITRLLPSGAADASINFEEGANSAVHTVVIQPDDMMVIAGSFTMYGNQVRNGIARVFGGATDDAGAITFASALFEVNEGSTNAVITLRRRGGTVGSVTAEVRTTAGTAVPGVNYTDVTTTVVFPEGEVVKTFLVPILRDIQITPDLTVFIDITSVSPPAEFGNQPYATLVIYNTDNIVHFESEMYFRNEDAVDGAATIRVVREGGLRLPASVMVSTTGGTAVPNLHYVPVVNTVAFAAGQQVAFTKVPVLYDPAAQGDTTVGLELTGAMGTLLSTPNTATLTIQDVDQAPGSLGFASTSLRAIEGAGPLTVTVQRSNGRSGVVTVDYRTLPGTAIPGVTYQPVSGRLTFSDGEVSKNFQVPIFDSSLVQGDSMFYVTLTNAIGAAGILDPVTVPVTVVDNDIGVSFSRPSYTTMDKDGTVSLTVIRQNGTNGITTVQYATTNLLDGAIPGTNYTSISGTLTFQPGELVKNFNVPILRDPRVTGPVSFGVNLSNPSAPAQLLNPFAAVVVIIDTDPGVGFTTNTFATVKSADNVVITLFRTNETPDTVSVDYSTTNGTAVAGVDYLATSGTAVFTNGAASASFVVPLVNNRVADSDKSFEVLLSGASEGVAILPPARASVIIANDLSGLGFSSPAFTVRENAVNATIEVVRSGYTNSVVSVEYATQAGSATPGSHYVETSGSLTFLPGETEKTFSVIILDNTLLDVDHTVLLSLKNPSGNGVLSSPAATLTILEDDGSFIVPAGAALAAESGPVNNSIDPGETVTLWLALRNASGTNTQNLVATLLAGPGIVNPSGPQSYGVLEVKGASAFRPFSFTASGTNGQPLAVTLSLVDGETSVSNAVFNLSIGNAVAGFTNGAMITINDAAPASPYPSTINVSGLGGVVSKVSVTVSNFNHQWPSDVSMLLVSPAGSKTYLMSRAGGSYWATNATLTFEDAASAVLPFSARITNGVVKPTSYSQLPPSFPVPVPYATNLSVFNGENPNGTWSLYVLDGMQLYSGAISNGWSLRVDTSMSVAADLGVSVTANEESAIVKSNISYTVTVMNHGPSAAANVLVTDILPAGAAYVSSVPSTGSATTNAAGRLVWSIGNLPVSAWAHMNVVVAPQIAGTVTNAATITSTTSDLNPDNNMASATTWIVAPGADLNLRIVGSGNPVAAGLNMFYTITVSNAGPSLAPNVIATYELPPDVQFVSVAPGGSSANDLVTLNLGDIDVGQQASGTITVRPFNPGRITDNYAICASDVTDPSKDDNEAMIKTTIESLDLRIEVQGSEVVLSWDALYTLQGILRSPTLNPPAWSEVPGFSPVTAGGRSSVRIPINGADPAYYYMPKQ